MSMELNAVELMSGETSLNLHDVQHAQAQYDAEFWVHNPGPDTVRHSALHVSKLAGKLATAAEVIDHGETPDYTSVDEEVVADLLIYAARIANNRGIDLNKAFLERTESLRQRFSQS